MKKSLIELFNNNNIKGLNDSIQTIDLKSLSFEDKEDLINIFNQTNNPELYDSIALLFSDLRDYSLLPFIIRKLESVKDSNYTETLLYACSEFDCSEFVDFFVDFFINSTDGKRIHTIYVLREIKQPIDKKQKNILLEKLYNRLFNEDIQGQEDINFVINLIKKL